MAKNMVNFYSQLECVNRYKYLGIHFCASGSFYFAQEELYKKAIKVTLNSQNPIVTESNNQDKYACFRSYY